MINVDCEKLADGIERGLYPGLEPPYESKFERLRLRLAMCGLASTSTQLFLDSMDTPSHLVLSHPDLQFDSGMEHVMVSINDDPTDPLIIDPTYSQFLKYTGFDIAYENISGLQVYPSERVIAFRTSERLAVVKGIAKAAIGFREIKWDLIKLTGHEWGSDWLPDVTTAEEIAECLNPIWDPANFYPFTPDPHTLSIAQGISQYIERDAVTILESHPSQA